MPSRSLPPVPNWDHIRKQAKDLLAQCRANDAAALSRAAVYATAFSSSFAVSNSAALRLSDAQLVVAREYGFASWLRLKRHVEQTLTSQQTVVPQLDSAIQTLSPNATDTVLESGSNPQAYPNDAQTIHSASWLGTYTMWDEFAGETTHSSQKWIRLNPPAYAWRDTYDDNSWSHDVKDANGHLHTASSWDYSVLSPESSPYTANELLRQVLFPPLHTEDSEQSPSAQEKLNAWQQDSVEEHGMGLLRWQQETISGNFQEAHTIWTEPATSRIAREEYRHTNLLTGRVSTVELRDRYTFNQPIPEGMFEMPPDKPIRMREETSISPEVWDTFTMQERQAVHEVIARSDAGWRNADVRAFSSAWKFDFQVHLPPKAQWKQRVAQQTELWSEWTSKVISANTQDYIPVLFNSHSSTWIVEKRKLLRVKVNVHVAWQEGVKGWRGTAEFFLYKHAGRYKIAHWECPWAEIEAARKQAMELS